MNTKKAISIGMATIILLTLVSAMPAAAYPYTTLHVTYTLGHSVFACGGLNDTGLAILDDPIQNPPDLGYNTSTDCWDGGDWWDDVDAYSHEWAHDNDPATNETNPPSLPYWQGKTTSISVALGRIYPGESRHIYFATENYANKQIKFDLDTENLKNAGNVPLGSFPGAWNVQFKIINDYGYDPINDPHTNCPYLGTTPINHFTVLSHDDYFNLNWTSWGAKPCTEWHNPSAERAIPIDRGTCDISQHPLEPAYAATYDHSNLYHVLELSIPADYQLNPGNDPVSFDIVVKSC